LLYLCICDGSLSLLWLVPLCWPHLWTLGRRGEGKQGVEVGGLLRGPSPPPASDIWPASSSLLLFKTQPERRQVDATALTCMPSTEMLVRFVPAARTPTLAELARTSRPTLLDRLPCLAPAHAIYLPP
jgi:hypothetical protein